MLFSFHQSRIVAIVAIVAITFGVVSARAVHAQNAPPTTPAPGEAPLPNPEKAVAQPLNSLGAALPFVNWDPKSHGILIAVAPDQITLPADPDTPPPADPNAPPNPDDVNQPLLAPKDRYGLNVALIARHFGRKLVHLPTVTVFAPAKMMTLNRNLKPANPYFGMSTEDKMRRLEASLTADQWKLLGSANGIGLGDMTKEQEPLFEEIIPENARVQQTELGTDDAGDLTYNPTGDGESPVTASQRAGLRIRLERSTSYFLVNPDGQMQWSPYQFHREPVGGQRLEMAPEDDSFVKSSSLFGQQLRLQAPNRLKPSDLDLTITELQVSLPVSGLKTVGELVKSIREKTGQPIYVDGRFGRLPIVIIGAEAVSVRAGDVLEALTWALTGTFRRVGPTAADPKAVYLLTFDRDGLAAVRGRMLEWARRGDAERRIITGNLDKSIFDQKPHQYLSFPTGDLLSPTPETLSALANPSKDNESPWTSVPVAALSAEQKQEVQAAVAAFNQQQKNNPQYSQGTVRTDRVGINLVMRITFVIPGVGEVKGTEELQDHTDQNISVSAEMDKGIAEAVAKAKPVSAAGIVLALAAPRDRAQADAVVAAAAERGVRQLWVRVPDSSDATARLGDCIAAAKAHQLPVVALLSLLQTTPPNSHPSWANINVYGETASVWSADRSAQYQGLEADPMTMSVIMTISPIADLLDPAAVAVRADTAARVSAIAAIPGLAGIALGNAAEPGYEGTHSPGFGRSNGDDFGYTLDNRLAFIKSKGYDPIDIQPEDYSQWEATQATQLPFIETMGGEDIHSTTDSEESVESPEAQWNLFRTAQDRDFLKVIRAGIVTRNASLPVYVSPSDGDPIGMTTGSFQLWSKPDAEPFAASGGDLLKSLAGAVKPYNIVSVAPGDLDRLSTFSPAVFKYFTETTMLELILQSVTERNQMPTNSRRSGTILDLSRYPLTEAITLTRAVLLPQHTTRAN